MFIWVPLTNVKNAIFLLIKILLNDVIFYTFVKKNHAATGPPKFSLNEASSVLLLLLVLDAAWINVMRGKGLC